MCANWGAVYDGMIGYRQCLDDDLQARSNMITEASEEFLEKMSKHLYADETDEALKELFAPYTEEFAWKTLYRIQMNDGTLTLERAEESRQGQP